jgi:hypothetical protein
MARRRRLFRPVAGFLSLATFVLATACVQPVDAADPPKEIASVTVYQIWARPAAVEKVPAKLAKYRQLLIEKTKKKQYKEFRLDKDRPPKTFELKQDESKTVELPQKYRTVITAAMEKKKCVLKVLLEGGGKKSGIVIPKDTSLMLLPIKKKDGWNMVLLIHYETAAK